MRLVEVLALVLLDHAVHAVPRQLVVGLQQRQLARVKAIRWATRAVGAAHVATLGAEPHADHRPDARPSLSCVGHVASARVAGDRRPGRRTAGDLC
jgi:hypothetical protein